MSCGSCSYDCSYEYISSESLTICPNADVSGIGVVIGYIVNAAIVLVIIIANYLFAFDPEVDPFLLDAPAAQSRPDFKPNPVDKLVIRVIREKFGLRPKFSNGVEKALMKCVLSMSDLQIFTGLSILISGFVQLQCGISRYHWHILVYLAWFSSLTHFGCLSFLQNYLFNHPGERIWRLFFMAAIVLMLMVALVPTGIYESSLKEGSAIICSFQHALRTNTQSAPFLKMLISLVFLVVGFLIRLFKLSPHLSTSTATWVGNPISTLANNVLIRLYEWSRVHKSPFGWRRLLVYRPLLAMSLVLRVLVDLYLSMFGEVLWMAKSFAWGLINLTQVRRSAPGGENTWTFGQVVPVVLIAAPVFTVVEFLYSDDEKSSLQATPRSHAAAPPHSPAPHSNSPPLQDRGNSLPSISAFSAVDEVRDNPDHDFYGASTWFQLFISLYIIVILEFSAYTLLIGQAGISVFIADSFADIWSINTVWVWALVYCPLYGISYISLAFLCEHHKSPRLVVYMQILLVVSMLFFITFLSPPVVWFSTILSTSPVLFGLGTEANWIPVLGYVSAYIFLAICVDVMRRFGMTW